MTPQEQQTRGMRASELLADQTLNEALDAIEQEVIDLWGKSPMRDHDGKEALWQLYKTSIKFRAILNGYVETGKLAREQLATWEKQGKIAQFFKR